MRIVHAISSIELASAGTTYCVTRLSEALAEAGHDITLVATSARPGERRYGRLVVREVARDLAGWPFSGRLMPSRAFAAEMERAAAANALIHSNGLWQLPNVYPGAAARRHSTPLVISPHGMLAKAALAFSSRKKRAFDVLTQRRVLLSACCFHATSRDEIDEIRDFGLMQPVALVPHGIDLPAVQQGRSAAAESRRNVLYLGRVHPKKGLDRLLTAWAGVEPTHAEWRLRIVGPSEIGHGEQLKSQMRALGLRRVDFDDGLYGAEKDLAYSDADLFVLPSCNENFAVVVAEALAAGTPVISTKGAPWSGLVANRCGWWVDHGPDPLAAALAEAMAMPSAELSAMGARGRDWMARDFSWLSVAGQMADVYGWLLDRRDRPSSVIL